MKEIVNADGGSDRGDKQRHDPAGSRFQTYRVLVGHGCALRNCGVHQRSGKDEIHH